MSIMFLLYIKFMVCCYDACYALIYFVQLETTLPSLLDLLAARVLRPGHMNLTLLIEVCNQSATISKDEILNSFIVLKKKNILI